MSRPSVKVTNAPYWNMQFTGRFSIRVTIAFILERILKIVHTMASMLSWHFGHEELVAAQDMMVLKIGSICIYVLQMALILVHGSVVMVKTEFIYIVAARNLSKTTNPL
jgi:hypothetical protein